MIYEENTRIVNYIDAQLKISATKDPASKPRISILRQSTPVYQSPYAIKQDMYIIALWDVYIITKPEYDRVLRVTDLYPKTMDGYTRTLEAIHQNEFEIIHDDCFDENLKGFFQRLWTVNTEIMTLPRYHPEELVRELLFHLPAKTLWDVQKETLFNPLIFFTSSAIDTNCINTFVNVMTENEGFKGRLNHFIINGQKIVFMNDRGHNNVSGDWLESDVSKIWSQVYYVIASYINHHLPKNKYDEFVANGWKDRIGNLIMVASYSTCYLTYFMEKTKGNIE